MGTAPYELAGSVFLCVCIVCVGELETEDRHHAQVQHSIDMLQRDMVRLSTLITEKRGKQGQLEEHNTLMEKGFVLNLEV